MSTPGVTPLRWAIGTDAAAIHELLCACDARSATAAAPAPRRNPETTRAYVAAGAVHVLTTGREVAGAITITWRPPFRHPLSLFPSAVNPAYITRLCVAPSWLERGSIAGARCIRHAVEVAAAAGADALRSEANPELASTLSLLKLCGFVEHARGTTQSGRRWALLQKALTPRQSRTRDHTPVDAAKASSSR